MGYFFKSPSGANELINWKNYPLLQARLANKLIKLGFYSF